MSQETKLFFADGVPKLLSQGMRIRFTAGRGTIFLCVSVAFLLW
ncbi:Uncharacterised protein [Trueperella pyogenes]|nr:Uncharacterised protein [Trueperella pyogenes]